VSPQSSSFTIARPLARKVEIVAYHKASAAHTLYVTPIPSPLDGIDTQKPPTVREIPVEPIGAKTDEQLDNTGVNPGFKPPTEQMAGSMRRSGGTWQSSCCHQRGRDVAVGPTDPKTFWLSRILVLESDRVSSCISLVRMKLTLPRGWA